VEITFKLLYEENNNELKLKDHLKEDVTTIRKQTNKQTWKICGKIQGSYFKI